MKKYNLSITFLYHALNFGVFAYFIYFNGFVLHRRENYLLFICCYVVLNSIRTDLYKG